MKFRSDFVTNSSSTSYMDCCLKFKDLTTEEIFSDDDYRTESPLYQNYDGVYWGNLKINTIDDLLACLYFFVKVPDIGSIESSLIPVLINVFRFLCGKKTFLELIADIKKEITECKDKPKWADDQGIQYLLGINYDEYVNEFGPDDLIDEVQEAIGNLLGADYLDTDSNFIDLSRKNLSLYDVYSLCFTGRDSDYGEMINYYIEELMNEFGEGRSKSLSIMSDNDPLFEKEVNKWEFLVDRSVHQNLRGEIIDIFLEVEGGLESGEYRKMISSIFYEYKKDEIFFYETPNVSDITETLTINTALKEKIENGTFHNFTHDFENFFRYKITSVVLPDGLSRIGSRSFMDWNKLKSVVIPDTVTEIGAFAFDSCPNLSLPQFPNSIQSIGLSCREDVLQYAIDNKLIKDIPLEDFLIVWNKRDLKILQTLHINELIPENIPEKDLYFALYDCIDKKNLPMMRFHFDIDRIPNHFSEYPLTDLLSMAMETDDNVYLDILLSFGFNLDYADVAHYIFTDSLEKLYPLFEKGLKIEESAYDALIDYAAEHGNAEYTAWLLEQRNKASVN